MKEEYEVGELVDQNKNTFELFDDYFSKEFDVEGTSTGDDRLSIKLYEPLPYDLDIFDIVRDTRVSSRPRVQNFLSKLKLAIKEREGELYNIHFNKLSLEDSENSNELMIDWIYNYFRAFFYFDDNQGDMYGLVLNNTVNLEFSSEFKPLMETEYEVVAEKTVEFIVHNIKR